MIDLAYTNQLEDALKQQKTYSVYNKDLSHAFAIVKTVFLYARVHVRLLSHKLDPSLYGDPDLITSVSTFLEKGAKLDILIEKEISSEHPMLMLHNKYHDRLAIAVVASDWVSQYKFNFMVVDDFGYRFEHDRSNHMAIASFYDPRRKEMITSLKYVFDHLFRNARILPNPM